MCTCPWLLGLVVALVGGFVAAGAFNWTVRKAIKLPPKPFPEIARIPSWLTGLIERTLFFLLVITHFDILASVPTWMLAWLGLKLGANWNRYKSNQVQDASTRALLALLTGAISLAFAYLGGYIAVGAMMQGETIILH